MGIDIYAYRKLRKTDKPIEHEDGHYVVDKSDEGLAWFDRGVSDAFDEAHEELYGTRPGYFDGLDDGFYYAYDEEESFFGCAYSTYSTFRDILTEYVAAKGLDEGTFREMIYFSDCDGTIGPKVCKKLLSDFEANLDGFCEFAKETLPEDGWFDEKFAVSLYKDYLNGLRYGADNGALIYA